MAKKMSVNERVALYMVISFLCVITVVFLFSIPRLVGRVWGRNDFKSCLILSKRTAAFAKARTQSSPSYSSNAPQLQKEKVESPPETPIEKKGSSSSSESSPSASMQMVARDSQTPLHVPSYTTLLHPLSSPFAWSVTRGFSGGKIVILVALIAVFIVVSFVSDGDPFINPKRLGWMATALIPLTVALGTKNNIIGVILGKGYEKLIFLHKWLGIASFVAANLHMAIFIARYILVDTKMSLSAHMRESVNIMGVGAILCIELLFFASLPFVRNRFYTTFLFSHVFGTILFFVFLHLHRPKTLNWIIASIAIYAFDHALRIFKTRLAVARISNNPSLGFTRVEFPSIKSGWRAGQHVRIRIVSSEMGMLGWTVAHPFTVTNVPGMCGDTGMVLFSKKTGAWTSGLYSLAARTGSDETEPGVEGRDVRVIVEGPYGGLGNMVMSSFTSALLVGGGSGVTFVLGQAEELVRDILLGKSSISFIEAIWITQDEASVSALTTSFASILNELPPSFGVFMQVSIFYTRASPSSISGREEARLSMSLASRCNVSAGRPSISETLERLARSAATVEAPRGVAVGVCGPEELIYDVKECARNVDSGLRRSCGGVEVHDEWVFRPCTQCP